MRFDLLPFVKTRPRFSHHLVPQPLVHPERILRVLSSASPPAEESNTASDKSPGLPDWPVSLLLGKHNMEVF